MHKIVNLNIKLEERLMRGFDETVDLVKDHELDKRVSKSSMVREGMIHVIKKYKKKYGKQTKGKELF